MLVRQLSLLWVLGVVLISIKPGVKALYMSASKSLVLLKDPTKLRYRSRVAYDGTSFSGFQCQSGTNRRTIQGTLEQVLSKRFNRPIVVTGASRTDAGVHARGQAIHFDLRFDECKTILLDNQWDLQLQTAMNRMLPSDVRVWNVGPAPPPTAELVHGRRIMCNWNSMKTAHSKLYCYRLCLSRVPMDPIEERMRWQPRIGHPNEIDPPYLQRLLKSFEGTKDYSCFAAAMEANSRKAGMQLHAVRTIHSCDLIAEDIHRGYYRIDVVLNGALYKMIRNIVGTVEKVCQKRIKESTFNSFLNDPETIRKGRNANPSKPAPPQGLTLERVYYQGDCF